MYDHRFNFFISKSTLMMKLQFLELFYSLLWRHLQFICSKVFFMVALFRDINQFYLLIPHHNNSSIQIELFSLKFWWIWSSCLCNNPFARIILHNANCSSINKIFGPTDRPRAVSVSSFIPPLPYDNWWMQAFAKFGNWTVSWNLWQFYFFYR
jgi:hypothetical protein